MEAAIQSNQIDLDKEEERPGTYLGGLLHERHVLRLPELPHSPRSVPTIFDIKSDLELIQGNVLRSEPPTSGSHRNISVPVQTMVQKIRGRGIGNFSRPLAGGHELLITHQEISGSGEENRNLRRMKSLVFQRESQNLKNWLKKQSLLSIEQKMELEMTRDLEKEGKVVSKCSKQAPEQSKDKPKGPQNEQRGPRNNKGKGQGKANWNRPYPQEYTIPKREP
ncbi:hypothetical protein O181_043030 [Austropuccinia psidii MF-1]|uniref:Uncharacterized protein n=1 Tax=Austropuccinia psidii MF-1 TaxID=1389203 RepID=A0A9Q3DLR6_9BASI|nr:hypothetical protein [Austropuccinia psidii MF-1]